MTASAPSTRWRRIRRGPSQVLPALVLWLMTGALAAQTVHREVLPNGLTLIVDDRGLTHAVELRAFVTAGPLYEGELLGTGVSGVVMGILSDAVRAGRIAGLGDLHAGDRLRHELAAGTTSFSLTTSDRFVEEGLRLLAGVLTHRDYDAEAVVQARELNLQRLADAAEDPTAVELDALRSSLLRVHPARLPLLGLEDQLGTLGLERVRRYHRERYTAPNTTVIVVGNVDVDRVRDSVRTAFEDLPVDTWDVPPVVQEPVQYRDRHAVRTGPALQERHAYAWRSVGPEHRDHAVVAVVATLLDPDGTSPLAEAFLERQLASDLAVELHAAADVPSFLRISYHPFPDRGAEAWLAVQQVLDRLAQEGPSDDQLAAAKHALKRRWVRSQARVATIAAELARWERTLGVPVHGETVLGHVDAITAEDVRRVVGTWLHPNGRNRCKVVLRPRDAAATTAEGSRGLTLADVPPRLEEVGSGVRLLTRRLPLGLAHLRVTIAGGAAADDPETRGASALLARLLTVGPKGHSGEELQRELARHGMELSAVTGVHATDLTLTCFPQDVPRALELLVAIIRDPAVPVEDVERLKQSTLAEIALASQGGGWDDELTASVRSTMLGDHYGAAPVKGTRETLADLDRETLLQHLRETAVGRRVVVSIYGEFDAAFAIAHLRSLLEAEPAIPEGEAWHPEGEPWPEAVPPSVTTLTWERQTGAVALAWPAPPLDRLDQDGAAMDLLGALLAGQDGSSGRLGRALGSAGIPVRDLRVSSEAYDQRGIWTARCLVAESRREAAARVLREAVTRLEQELAVEPEAAQALPASELEAARSRCVVRRILEREDQAQAISAHVRSLLFRGGSEADLAYEKRIRAVTREDLLRVMRTYFAQSPAEIRMVPRAEAPAPDPTPDAPADAEGRPADGAPDGVAP